MKVLKRDTHGTFECYRYHKCTCALCRKANADRCYEQRLKRRNRPKEIPHGTPSGYSNWECKCQLCYDAYWTPEQRRRDKIAKKKYEDKRRVGLAPKIVHTPESIERNLQERKRRARIKRYRAKWNRELNTIDWKYWSQIRK